MGSLKKRRSAAWQGAGAGLMRKRCLLRRYAFLESSTTFCHCSSSFGALARKALASAISTRKDWVRQNFLKSGIDAILTRSSDSLGATGLPNGYLLVLQAAFFNTAVQSGCKGLTVSIQAPRRGGIPG
jgi:hypothetical protein